VPDPATCAVDVRLVSEQTIVVRSGDGGRAPAGRGRAPGEEADNEPAVVVSEEPALGRGQGRIEARSFEPEASVELSRTEFPYESRVAVGELAADVPAGAYRVRFRLGQDAYSEHDVYVEEGNAVKVKARVERSEIVEEAMLLGAARPATVELPEIGPAQTAVLATILPLVAVAPFDEGDEIPQPFRRLVEPRGADEFHGRPLVVAVAIDGSWPASTSEALAGLAGSVAGLGPAGIDVEIGLPRLEPLLRSTLGQQAEDAEGYGLRRIGLSLGEAPASSFLVSIGSRQAGRFTFAAASLTDRVTVVSLVLRADGSFDLMQNLLRIPGREYPGELVHYIGYPRMVRELQIGQELFKSGDLVTSELTGRGGQPGDAAVGQREVLRDLLYAKWTDPILSSMALQSWLAVQGEPSDLVRSAPYLVNQSARNLSLYFRELPDTKIAYALVNPDKEDGLQERTFDELLAAGSIPVLGEHARLLARFAEGKGRDEAPVLGLAGQFARDQPWSLTLSPDGLTGLTAAGRVPVAAGV
jgi:hypothetical protein